MNNNLSLALKFAKAVGMDLVTAPQRVYTTIFNSNINQGRGRIAAIVGSAIGGTLLQGFSAGVIATKMAPYITGAHLPQAFLVAGAGITALCGVSAIISDVYENDQPMPRTQRLMNEMGIQ